VDNHVEELIEFKERCKSNTKRLDEHDEQIKELSNVYIALTKVDDKVTNVENNVSEIKLDLKEIKEKPVKNWDKVVTTIIGTIVGALVGAVIGLILK
jgi:uncharacterized protein YcfJ